MAEMAQAEAQQTLRDQHHHVLKQAEIQIVMLTKSPKVGGAEVTAKVRVHDPLMIQETGLHATILFSGEWFDDNDPRQANIIASDRPGDNVNRRMCARVLDECLCSLYWDGERLRKQPPVQVYKGVLMRWGPMPGTMEAEVAEVLVEREAQGVGFLSPLNGSQASDA